MHLEDEKRVCRGHTGSHAVRLRVWMIYYSYIVIHSPSYSISCNQLQGGSAIEESRWLGMHEYLSVTFIFIFPPSNQGGNTMYIGWPGMNTGLSVAIIIHSNSPSSLYYTAMPCHTIPFAHCIHSKINNIGCLTSI